MERENGDARVRAIRGEMTAESGRGRRGKEKGRARGEAMDRRMRTEKRADERKPKRDGRERGTGWFIRSIQRPLPA